MDMNDNEVPVWLAKLKDDPEYIAKAGRKTFLVDFDVPNYAVDYAEEVPIEKANCYSSESRLIPGMHLPCFDVDYFPNEPAPQMGLLTMDDIITRSIRQYVPEKVAIRWMPSATMGHHHVYVEYALEWPVYLAILAELAVARIVERGYYNASQKQRATYVRLPGVPHDRTPKKPAAFLPGNPKSGGGSGPLSTSASA
jgi:hypothetical protein